MSYISEAITLLNQSGYKTLQDVRPGVTLPGDTALVTPLHIGRMTVSYLIGERNSDRNITHEMMVALKQGLLETFNNEDFNYLTFDLGLPEGEFPGPTYPGRVEQLIGYMKRRGRLAELTDYCRKQRSHLSWPSVPQVATPALVEKKELAIVVSMNQLNLENVASYLTEKNINVHYLLITPAPDYSQTKFLPDDRDWGDAVQDFFRTLQHQNLKKYSKRHFFFACPLPYVFAIGCAWGTVHDGDDLYHWSGSRYIKVMTSSRTTWKNG